MEVWHPEEFKTLCHSSGVSFPVKFLKVIKVFSFFQDDQDVEDDHDLRDD